MVFGACRKKIVGLKGLNPPTSSAALL